MSQKVNDIQAALQTDIVLPGAEFHVYLHDGTEIVNYSFEYTGPDQVTLPSGSPAPAKMSLKLGAS